MKKILIPFLILALSSVMVLPAFAGSNTGCGLGSMVWDGNADTTLFQVFEATTNATSGNQTFGITSGTLGCDQPSSFVVNERLQEFAGANMDSLARDIAMGQGESLSTLAELMEISNQDQFASTLQANFDTIFVTGTESSAVVLDRISSLI